MTPEESDRRQQILEAAMRVFAQQGFHKASIKLIAKAANLKSSALIYWYFKDKKDLLWAIVRQQVPVVEQIEQLDVETDLPPEVMLPTLATSYLSIIDNPAMLQLFRIFFSEVIHGTEVGEFFAEHIFKELLGIIERYLQHQMDLGRLRPHDPNSAARAFMGMFVAYVLNFVIATGQRDLMPPRELYINTAVGIFLQGLQNERTS